jgi:hypothetical protein
MRPEVRDALRDFAATVNHLAATGQLPDGLAGTSYRLLAALDLPENEVPAVPRG